MDRARPERRCAGYRQDRRRLRWRRQDRADPHPGVGLGISGPSWRHGGRVADQLPDVARGGSKQCLGLHPPAPRRDRRSHCGERGLSLAALYSNENFPLPVVQRLRQLGHDVLTTANTGKAGDAIPDPEVLAFASAQGHAAYTLSARLHSPSPEVRSPSWDHCLHLRPGFSAAGTMHSPGHRARAGAARQAHSCQPRRMNACRQRGTACPEATPAPISVRAWPHLVIAVAKRTGTADGANRPTADADRRGCRCQDSAKSGRRAVGW